MESVDEIPEFNATFDAVYAYEALHHAYDWRKTLHAAATTLKQGAGYCSLASPIACTPASAIALPSYRGLTKLDLPGKHSCAS